VNLERGGKAVGREIYQSLGEIIYPVLIKTPASSPEMTKGRARGRSRFAGKIFIFISNAYQSISSDAFRDSLTLSRSAPCLVICTITPIINNIITVILDCVGYNIQYNMNIVIP
jgi:hypothetical protein